MNRNSNAVHPLFKNTDAHLRHTNFLADQMVRKGYEWNPAKMKPMDGALVVNKEIEVGGTQDLLTGGSVKERGINGFDGNKLVKGRVFSASDVAFGWAVDDAGKPAHSVDFNYNTAPAYLKQAVLVMKQKDEKIISLPIIDIINTTGKGDQGFYRKLDAFALIEDESVIEYTLEFPAGANANLAAGKALYVSAYIKGLETHLKR